MCCFPLLERVLYENVWQWRTTVTTLITVAMLARLLTLSSQTFCVAHAVTLVELKICQKQRLFAFFACSRHLQQRYCYHHLHYCVHCAQTTTRVWHLCSRLELRKCHTPNCRTNLIVVNIYTDVMLQWSETDCVQHLRFLEIAITHHQDWAIRVSCALIVARSI